MRVGRLGRSAGALATFVAFVTFAAFVAPAYQASQAPTSRVISLVPALTEMVFAMGAGDKVVAVSSYDDYPPQVKSLPSVGALIDPDVERIITLKPDLVLLYGSQTDLMTQLSRASIPFFQYRHGGLAGVTTTIRAIGQAIGHAKAANDLASGIEQRMAALRQKTAGLQKPRTMLVFERDGDSLRNIYVSGGRGFLHEMLEAAGGVNVFADVAAESLQVSTETIIVRAPEIIIELQAESTSEQQSKAATDAWKLLGSLPAVRSNRVHLLVGRSLVVPGPRVAEGAERMAGVLHPNLKVLHEGSARTFATIVRTEVPERRFSKVLAGGSATRTVVFEPSRTCRYEPLPEPSLKNKRREPPSRTLSPEQQ